MDGVRWDLDWVKLHILIRGKVRIGLGWSWCAILVTWMEVPCDLNWGETPNSGPGCSWAAFFRTWMEVRRHRDGNEMQISGPGLRWDFNMGACMEVKCEYGGLDWIEIQPRWRRDANLWTLMETVHGWRRDKNLVAWISLIRTRMEVRLTYWNLDGFGMVPGWIRDATWGDWNGGETSPCCCSEANIWTWIEVRRDLDGEETWI